MDAADGPDMAARGASPIVSPEVSPEVNPEAVTATGPSLDLATLENTAASAFEQLSVWAQSPEFYVQCGMVGAALFVAWVIAGLLRRRLPQGEFTDASRWIRLLAASRPILFPVIAAATLGAAASIADAFFEQAAVLRVAQGFAIVAVIYVASRSYLSRGVERAYVKWIVIPVAVLYVVGWLPGVIDYLESVTFVAGNISLSLYALARVVVFGSLLFWMGRRSNTAGQRMIREHPDIERDASEVFAKLFEIGIYILTFFLLLQVMGISLTALAVFGGALGVGLGFGLQAIASNFVSGMIILLDRSLKVGDHIELEDGRAGSIRALTMRSAILQTFDGKDVVVPNETFVTQSFTNWTHDDARQRYGFEFQVAYDTDIERLCDLVRNEVATHPQVLAGTDEEPELAPDAEISDFADSGIAILVEFWMEGIDDGRNRVDADLKMMVWKLLKQQGIQMPFPQREVRVLKER